jgi:hypothetical protein
MNTIHLTKESEMSSDMPARIRGISDWQRWAPYAAVAWSLVYAALGFFWSVSGNGFPYNPETTSGIIQPLIGQLGLTVAWIVVIMAGLPAAAMGIAMLRGTRSKVLRPLFITAGLLLAGALMLLMTDFTVLGTLAYIPYIVFRLLTGAEISFYVQGLTQWAFLHQLLCLIGGFLWLAATFSYARRSGDACLVCGRRDGPEGWTSPDKARRWGRIAVYVAMVVPVLYALTRYAWAVGIPLGMTEEYWRQGQERGEWISGLFLANVALVGAILMLGLVQRWGEVFPRWMIGLAGRRVPIALAVVPAAIMSVLLIVGGTTILSGYTQMAIAAEATGQNIWIVVGPAFLLPLWGAPLAVATLGYYYRRRGPCDVCGRGTPGEIGKPSSSHSPSDHPRAPLAGQAKP